MSDKSNQQAASGITQAGKAVIVKEAHTLAHEFEQLLQQENAILETASVDHLHELAARKQLILDSLATLEPQLIPLFEIDSSESEVQSLKDTLSRCQLQNRSNKQLSQLVLQHTSNSLELLRSLQQMNDLSLYESNGELNIKREQRHLGSA